jgi:hypothetical protein
MTILKLGVRIRTTVIKLLLQILLLSVCSTVNAACVVDIDTDSIPINGFYAVGDSITSAPGSWAELLRDCGWRVQLHAQGGRLAKLWRSSPDLRVTTEFPYWVYFLGTNDFNAEFVNDDSGNTDHFENFKVGFLESVAHAVYQNFTPVILIPADYPRLQDGIPGGREFMIEFCATATVSLICIDMEDHWDYSQTIEDDQIHPTALLHVIIAKIVHDKLITLPVPQESLPPGC